MKKTMSFILALILVFGIVFSVPITVSATSKTANEAIAWCQSQVGKSLDYDGNGYWCVDLIAKYYQFLGTSTPGGHAYQYSTNKLPSGWVRTKGGKPQKGDILVWAGGSGAGHVAIYESDYSTYHQRYNGPYVQKVTKYYKDIKASDGAGYWGCIHPNFSGSSVSYNYQSITPDMYYLRSNGQSTYNYLTVSGTSTSSGAAVNAWTFMTQSRLQIANNGGKFYTMKFPAITTANAVNVHTDSTYPTATTKVSNYKYSGSTTQSWGFDKVSGGYVIRCKANENMVLTCNGSGQATISAYSSGNANQVWTLIPYVSGTVQYNANGGSGAPSSQTKYFNQTLTLSSTKPTRAGYTFKGWSTSSSATSPSYYAGSSYTSESGTTLYAVWERNVTYYTISYNANGGSGAPSSQTKQNGVYVFLSSNVPVRSGYTFVEWSTRADGTGTTYDPGDLYGTDANVTLYAIWKANSYTLYFNANGGTCDTASKTVAYGSACGTLPVPSRIGYSFEGWYTGMTGGSKYTETSTYDIMKNTTFYARWTLAHDHVYDENVIKAATCTETGIAEYTCFCGDSYESIIHAAGHTSGEWIYTSYPTVDHPGYAYNSCIYCGKVLETEEFPQFKPDTPQLTAVTSAGSGAYVIWDEADGADSYLVYRRVYNATAKKWSGWSCIAKNVESTSYVDRSAKSGTFYIYTVKATNEAGYSGHTSGLKTYFLATPKITSTANTNSVITVKWGKVAGAGGYIVYRKTTGGWTKVGVTKGTAFNDKTAKAGVTYRYTVRAYLNSYVSAYNTNGTAIRRLTTPKLTKVTSSKSGVTLNWGKVAGAQGYIVYRKTGNGSWTKLAIVKGASTVKYVDKTAKKGVTYTYTVRAYYGSSASYYNTKGLKIKDKY